MIYRWLLRPLLYTLPAETAHHLAMAMLRLASGLPGLRHLLTWYCGRPDPSLESQAFGRTLTSPVGLAAGFDKDAMAYPALAALGFGFVEVGTLTAEAQPGNPRPRLFRLPKDRALVNRMGFNNRGAADAAARLASRPSEPVLGVNIGKTKRVSDADAVADYVQSATQLAPFADYLVVNVSSPNTPGLRDLQGVERLRPLLQAVLEVCRRAAPTRSVPLFVKIAPDLADADVDAVADLALELGLAGIVATNTTIARAALRSSSEEIARCGAGGLSGAPLKSRALEVLARLRGRVGRRLMLIAAGGIETPEDAWERICAGATLLQVYTGLVYEGPALPNRLARGLAERLRLSGWSHISQAVGSAVDGRGSDAAVDDAGAPTA